MRLALAPLLAACLALSGCDGGGDASDDAGRADASARADGGGPEADARALPDAGDAPGVRAGPVRLVGRELHDDGGAFVALGASYFSAAWAYRNDRPRLERNLAWLRDHGFHYIRALGLVGDPEGADYWDGREIVLAWSDYDEVIAGLTDLAWDTYGLRVEWTLIGDGQVSIPSESDRYALVDRFVAMASTRADAILHFEIANEAWQNGFDGDDGNTQLRALSQYMRDRTDVIVAASAPSGRDCDGTTYVYGAAGEIADLATIHFDRDLGFEEGHWGPVRQPWTLAECGDWVGSNNEPIGPGASVAMEDHPIHLAAAALTTWVAGLPMHVFHSSAGVRGDVDISEMPGADAFEHVAALVPGDLPGWDRRRGDEADAPLRFFAEGSDGVLVADATWMDVPEPPVSGVVRGHGAIRGSEFVLVPIGILGTPTVEARSALTFESFDPLTGARIAEHTLAAGERTTLSGGEALVLRGRRL